MLLFLIFAHVDLIYWYFISLTLFVCSLCSFKMLLYIFLLKLQYLQFLFLN